MLTTTRRAAKRRAIPTSPSTNQALSKSVAAELRSLKRTWCARGSTLPYSEKHQSDLLHSPFFRRLLTPGSGPGPHPCTLGFSRGHGTLSHHVPNDSSACHAISYRRPPLRPSAQDIRSTSVLRLVIVLVWSDFYLTSALSQLGTVTLTLLLMHINAIATRVSHAESWLKADFAFAS
ncbi:hypothetical protein L1887_60782 [Cichorium endivia]|nr:hypothetical protein L1887_60782 [Cichorium endivia]